MVPAKHLGQDIPIFVILLSSPTPSVLLVHTYLLVLVNVYYKDKYKLNYILSYLLTSIQGVIEDCALCVE